MLQFEKLEHLVPSKKFENVTKNEIVEVAINAKIFTISKLWSN